MTRAAAATSSGRRRMLAPGATTIMFWPAASTVMKATPVAAPGSVRTRATSIPSRRRPESCCTPNASAPTHPIIVTAAPSRAAATAWFAPLPPGKVPNSAPVNVSPTWGRRGVFTTRSMLRLPTTHT